MLETNQLIAPATSAAGAELVDKKLMEEVMEKIGVKNTLETVGNQAYFAGRYLICNLYLKVGIGATNLPVRK